MELNWANCKQILAGIGLTKNAYGFQFSNWKYLKKELVALISNHKWLDIKWTNYAVDRSLKGATLCFSVRKHT